MPNQSQDVTEKQSQQKLVFLKCKQTFRDIVAYHPRRRKNKNLTNKGCCRNVIFSIF